MIASRSLHDIAVAVPGPFAFETVPDSVRVEGMHSYKPLYDAVGVLALAGDDNPLPSFWAPARLVRATMDYYKGHDRPEFISDVTDFAVEAYAGHSDQGRLAEITTRFRQSGLFSRYVEQTYDKTTIEAASLERSIDAANKLLEKTDDPLLVIAIGHGGILPAIQSMLYHQRFGGAQSVLYPVRFSRTKKFDRKPFATAEELDFLRDMAQDHTVVIYDDDATTGKTVTRAIQYFREHNIVGNGILGISSYERRSDRQKAKQGLWWENV